MTGQALRADIEQLKRKIFEMTRLDCNQYKEDFFAQCVQKRLKNLGMTSIPEYAGIVSRNPQEAFELVETCTVYHSQFMRDAEKFKMLQNLVLPDIIARKRAAAGGKKSLRIWSAGCAGGEEPYSIAMILHEVLGRELSAWDIQITATDINTALLEKARAGVYEAMEFNNKNVTPINPYYLNTYFTRTGTSFRVHDPVKRLVAFEPYNLMTDAPRMGMDIIFCRNVLIYFDVKAIVKIITGFFRALNENGYLVLGNSEILHEDLYCHFKKIKSNGEFVYQKITHGSDEHKSAVERQKKIKACLGIPDDTAR